MWTKIHLVLLRFPCDCSLAGMTPVTSISCLADLKCLTTLIVSETPAFGDAELKMVCKEMRYMRVLDLSQTIITAIAPLISLK